MHLQHYNKQARYNLITHHCNFNLNKKIQNEENINKTWETSICCNSLFSCRKISHCRTPGSPWVPKPPRRNNVMQPNFMLNTSEHDTNIPSIKNEQRCCLPNHHTVINIDHSTAKCTYINHKLYANLLVLPYFGSINSVFYI